VEYCSCQGRCRAPALLLRTAFLSRVLFCLRRRTYLAAASASGLGWRLYVPACCQQVRTLGIRRIARRRWHVSIEHHRQTIFSLLFISRHWRRWRGMLCTLHAPSYCPGDCARAAAPAAAVFMRWRQTIVKDAFAYLRYRVRAGISTPHRSSLTAVAHIRLHIAWLAAVLQAHLFWRADACQRALGWHPACTDGRLGLYLGWTNTGLARAGDIFGTGHGIRRHGWRFAACFHRSGCGDGTSAEICR